MFDTEKGVKGKSWVGRETRRRASERVIRDSVKMAGRGMKGRNGDVRYKREYEKHRCDQ